MVSEKMIHRAFRTHTTLDTQNPIRENFNFHYLSKLYIGFKFSPPYIQKQILNGLPFLTFHGEEIELQQVPKTDISELHDLMSNY